MADSKKLIVRTLATANVCEINKLFWHPFRVLSLFGQTGGVAPVGRLTPGYFLASLRDGLARADSEIGAPLGGRSPPTYVGALSRGIRAERMLGAPAQMVLPGRRLALLLGGQVPPSNVGGYAGGCGPSLSSALSF